MLSTSLVGVTSFIEDDVEGSFTEDVGLTFCNILDPVRTDVMVLVEMAGAFVCKVGVTCSTWWTRNKTETFELPWCSVPWPAG